MIWRKTFFNKVYKNHAVRFSWVTIGIGCTLGLFYLLISPPIIHPYSHKVSLTIGARNRLTFNIPDTSVNGSGSHLSLLFDKNKNVVNFDPQKQYSNESFISLPLISQFIQYPKPQILFLPETKQQTFAYISVEKDTLCLFIRELNSKKIQRNIRIKAPYPAERMLKTKYKFLGKLTNKDNVDDRLYFSVEHNQTTSTIYYYSIPGDSLVQRDFPNVSPYSGVSLIVPNSKGNGNIAVLQEDTTKNEKSQKILIINDKLNTVAQYPLKFYFHVYHKNQENNIILDSKNTKLCLLLDLNKTLKEGRLAAKPLPLPKTNGGINVYTPVLDNNLYALYNFKQSLLVVIDTKNGKIEKVKLPKQFKYGPVYYVGDLNHDGSFEILTTNTEIGKEALLIIDAHNGKVAAEIPVNRESLFVHKTYLSSTGALIINTTYSSYKLRLQKNEQYYLRWLWWGFVLIVFTLIVYIIQWVTVKRQQKILFYKNQLNELHLRNLRNRFDPHFVFNAINSSSSFLLKGDRFEAYNYLSKLSQLLRFSLKTADQFNCNLKEELNNCLKFLELQQMRFPGRFTYEIENDNEIDLSSIEVPTGLLINLTDNCIKHGFPENKASNKILIRVTSTHDAYLISVEDNGIGRKSASTSKQRRSSTGTGQHIIEQYVNILNQDPKKKVDFRITDLKDGTGTECGTKCVFFIFK